ncbi:bifunctional UDP-N-acetylglucosamine diphosphorylase/glucosamine-1-phosphate N-acetyltransferase GlmU [Vallicoccus soli]
MRSSLPKVLHPLCGRTLVGHAVAAARALQPEHLVVVVGHGRDAVRAHLAEADPGVVTAVQDRQLGTGHAVACGLEALPPLTGTVVVTYGDVPLLSGTTLRALVEAHERDGNAVTVLTALLDDPTGYGRVLRAVDGTVAGIVEEKDATPEQRTVYEVNSGIYAFTAAALRDGLARLTTDNAQGELYLTDVLALARAAGGRVDALRTADTWQTEGVNDRVQLARVRRELNRRVVEAWMRAGVTVEDPGTTWVDVDVTVGRDAVLRPQVQLLAGTVVGEGAVVGPDTTLRGTRVGPGAQVVRSHCEGAVVGEGAAVGPFAYLRPGAVLGAGAKVGTYVEVKGSTIGAGSKVPHLSYVGDAQIGEGANIGAATVFVNYDGVAKHRTVVGDHVRVGSDTMLVAPLVVGDGAYTAAGSVVTQDVPPGAMAVARGRQRNVEGWVERRRAGSPAAEAARRAREQGAREPGGREPGGREPGGQEQVGTAGEEQA